MNEPRNRIFNSSNSRNVCSVVVAAFGIQTVTVPFAFADVAMPPPAQHQNASFPSEQALRNMGYNPDTGVWRVNAQNTGRAEVKKDGGTITGSQPKTVTATGVHGEKAQIATVQRQDVSVSKLQTASNAVTVGIGFSNAANSASPFTRQMGESIAKGNYGNAAWNAVQALANAADGFFSSPGKSLTNLFESTANGYLDGKDAINSENQDRKINAAVAKVAASKAKAAQAQAERSGDFRAAVANAAAAKAANAAAEAEKKAEAEKQAEKEANAKGLYRHDIVFEFSNNKNGKYYKNYVAYSTEKNDRAWGRVTVSNISWWHYSNRDSVTFWLGQHFTPQEIEVKVNVPKDTYTEINLRSYPAGSPDIPDAAKNAGQVNQSDFVLNQKEMLDILKRMLENNQTNHAELMNQLAKMGNVVPDSTTSTEFTPATATTAPYTPSGSNTPQQTQITINRDGSMTTSIIPRNDLVPNSPQAPTRSALIPNNPSTPTTPTSPTSPTTPTTPNSPNNTSTPITPDNPTVPNKPKEDQPPQENTAYEDPDIPTQTVDLDFKPADIFSVDGVCPEPRTVDFGMFGQHEFSYQPLCDFASRIRPILILITIVSCSFFVYSSLKE